MESIVWSASSGERCEEPVFQPSVRSKAQFAWFFALFLLALHSLGAQNLVDGVAALEAGRLDEAERILSTVVTQQPDSADANYYLGLALFRAGRSGAARPPLERAVKLSPASAPAWKTLGLATMSVGDLDGALPALGKACDLAPQDEDACYYLARDLHALGRYEAACEPFEKALRAAPKVNLPKVHRAIALNFSALGMTADAEQHFLKAIQLNGRAARDGEDPRVDYGAFLFRQGRTEEALRPLDQAVHDAPSSPRANLERGRVLLHLEKMNDAVACLEKAVALEPANWNAHLLLGRAYLRLGRTSDGEREMRLGQEGWAGKK
jgi:Flp pilus assembly protein TadD